MYIRHYILLIALLASSCALRAQGFGEHSVLQQGTWYKLSIAETGIYRLTTTDLAWLKGKSTNQLALYGGTGAVMSAENSIARPKDLTPCAIEVVDRNGNGSFDDDDYILFYAEGPDTWQYNSTTKRYQHQRHPYDNYNYMFLTLSDNGAKRIATAKKVTSNRTVDSYTARSFYEKDQINTHNTGQVWVGEGFSNASQQRSFTLTLPHISANSPVSCRIALASIANGNSQFSVSLNGSTQSNEFTPAAYYNIMSANYTSSNAALTFSINYSSPVSSAIGYLDFIEVNAEAPLRFVGSQLPFRNHLYTDSLAVQYVMSGASSQVTIWDVTDINNIERPALTLSGNTLTFGATTEQVHEFVAFDGSSFLSPAIISSLSNQDIRGQGNPDMIIVTNSQFMTQAEQLATLHTLFDNMEVQVWSQEEVFNEFSEGKKDPMAIREMFRMFNKRAETDPSIRRPTHLLMFGKGTYDNRDLLNNQIPTVVTYQSPTSFTTDGAFSASDDMLGYLGDSEAGRTYESLDLAIGRLPARSTAEANLLVDKIERYLMKNDLGLSDVRGDWRNYVTLLADDADPSCASDVDFALSSENISSLIEERYPWINLEKIYADAYQQQSGAIGSYYPDATNALKQRMNYGCLLLNYIGHGSDQYIGTERYMQETDMANYTNTNQLAFFVTSTCSFGKYDRLDGNCGAEMFMLSQGAGVGAVAAARPISHIRSFNTALVMNTLDNNNSVGEALRITKNSYPLSQNKAITLLGDPALHLSVPELNIRVTAINGRMVDTAVADSCLVLSEVTVEGVIEDDNGALQSNFDGLIYPIVFDRPTQCRTLANDNEGTEVDFTQQKNILYKGVDSVVNGRFSYSFIVPRDVSYQFGQGKLSHYAKSASTDASGSYQNILFGGFNDSVDLSETRPEIRLFMNDSNFVSGGLTNEDPSLYAILWDEVGINAVGSGMGHDITAILDDNPNDLIILNDFYQTDIADGHRGYIRYDFSTLAPGRHTLTLKAWNIYNYSNQASIEFVVQSADTASIGRFFAYPNPATEQTVIHLEHNCPQGINSAVVTIFDMRGQQVRQFSPSINNDSFVVDPIHWDFCTEGGAALQRGIYLVRGILTTTDGETLVAATRLVKL